MKLPNYLINCLAFVGVISFIIAACSADDSSSAANVSTTGKYQISSSPSTNYGEFHVLDTETGIVKTFERNQTDGPYLLTTTTNTQ